MSGQGPVSNVLFASFGGSPTVPRQCRIRFWAVAALITAMTMSVGAAEPGEQTEWSGTASTRGRTTLEVEPSVFTNLCARGRSN